MSKTRVRRAPGGSCCRSLRELRRVRHHGGNSLFRPKRASRMGYRAFRETRMATGIERSRRPNSPFSRPHRRGRLRLPRTSRVAECGKCDACHDASTRPFWSKRTRRMGYPSMGSNRTATGIEPPEPPALKLGDRDEDEMLVRSPFAVTSREWAVGRRWVLEPCSGAGLGGSWGSPFRWSISGGMSRCCPRARRFAVPAVCDTRGSARAQ
jgi:hypothetical protein